MEHRIETIGEKKLTGKRIKMSLTENRTGELWRSFMLERNNIAGTVGTDLYSMQIYPASYFQHFNPQNEFEKWAAIEVTGSEAVPAGFESIILPAGLYAVFPHKGSGDTGAETFRYIFGTWLPSSDYVPDDRPHFELLGAKYKNNDPDSEEEFWIPVRPK
jgi:AraC family transcriptional regulator